MAFVGFRMKILWACGINISFWLIFPTQTRTNPGSHAKELNLCLRPLQDMSFKCRIHKGCGRRWKTWYEKKNPYPGLRYAIEKIEFMTTDISCHDFPRKNENRLKPGVYHWKIYALNRWTYLKIIDLWQLKKDSWCLHWRMKTGDGKLMVYILYT